MIISTANLSAILEEREVKELNKRIFKLLIAMKPSTINRYQEVAHLIRDSILKNLIYRKRLRFKMSLLSTNLLISFSLNRPQITHISSMKRIISFSKINLTTITLKIKTFMKMISMIIMKNEIKRDKMTMKMNT